MAELGLDLATVGRDLSAAVGGNYVNRFSVAGRSYKVIPQLTRLERLNPEQLAEVHVTGPGGQLVSLGTIAHRGALEPGVNFIAKPFSLDALERKVAEVLARARGP